MARTALRWHGDTAAAFRALREGVSQVGAKALLPGFGMLQGLRYGDEFLVAGDSAMSQALSSATAADFTDPAAYYLLKAQVARLRGQSQAERIYSDSARSALVGIILKQPEAGHFGRLGVAYAGLGRRDEAIRAAKRGVELLPITKEAYRGSVILLELARVEVMTGSLDPAIEILGQLLAVPSIISAAGLRVDPIWKPLQGNARFEALLAAHPVPQ
jgi:hypothetical protein